MNKQELVMSAISNMLFGQSGVDVSGIVADMCPKQDEEATTTRCAIALALNGKTAPIPKEIRYDGGWKCYTAYRVLQASLIKGEYWVEATRYIPPTDGSEQWSADRVSYSWMSPAEFEGYKTELEDGDIRGMVK